MPVKLPTGMETPRLTKIICTISDLKSSVAFIRELYNAGMDVVRLNTAHQSVPSTERIIHSIRQVSAEIAIMLDTKGAEMRTCGMIGELNLVEEQTVTIVTGRSPDAAAMEFGVNTPLFVENIPLQAPVLIDEGKIVLEVINKEKDIVTCRVLQGGTLLNRRSVNVPGVDMSLPGLTEQDRAYIDMAIREQVDFIAHSFVRCKEDVLRLQTILYDAGSAARVIAKIENREGIEHLPEIMECAWGILIARGDLGIEIPAAQVPLIQKAIIRQCRQAGKPVILATHILGSMTGNIRPTQAEVNDVANAVLDGVDALTLTGETAEGIYPVKVTKTLSELCRYTEAWQDEAIANKEQYPEGDHQLMQVIHKVLDAAGKKSICAVIDETASDMVVNMLAAARCGVPVLQRCVSPVQKRQCVLHYGVFPLSDSLTKHSPGSFVFDENARVAVLKSVPAGANGKIDIEYTTAKGIDIITII